jgi:PAS domain S-box-containing protein
MDFWEWEGSVLFDRRMGIAGFCAVSLFLVVLLRVPGAGLAQDHPQSALQEKNVLVLHSFESNVPIFELTDRGLRAALDAGGVGTRNQFFEYLDLARNPGPEHWQQMVDLMRLRYGHRKLDVIITMYPEALQFAVSEGRSVFPETPIVALYLPKSIEEPGTDRRIIGHTTTLDMIRTFEIALKLVPGAERVYVVNGAHKLDKNYEAQTQRDLRKWERQLEFRYLNDMPFEGILATVSKAPPKTIVFLTGMAADVTGRNFTTREVAKRLSQISQAPVFGVTEVMLGQGITGGFLIRFEEIGTRAGQLAVDILSGAKTTEHIPRVLDVPSVPMFDWRQLRRWKLSEGALPEGSIVINKEFTLWDLRYYAVGILAFMAAQSLLIAALLLQKRRRVSAEESLLRKTEELDQFFNVSLDLLCIANTEGFFLRLNPASERILGYTREELMARRFLDFVHHDDLERTREAVSILASQQEVSSFENRYRCKDGTYRWLQWSSAPAGKLIYAAARDVTERKWAQEELRRHQEDLAELVRERTEELVVARDQAQVASQAKTAFLANMSHELRTPLNSILGVAQLLERDDEFPERHTEFLRILNRSGAHLLDLIDDVLEMSKIETGQTTAVRTPFDFHRFLCDLENMMRLRALAKRLELVFESDLALPRCIVTDERKLRQILLNLIGNGIKYTEKGCVRMRAKFRADVDQTPQAAPACPAAPESAAEDRSCRPDWGENGYLEFEVEDTGIGIAPEDMERIFEPFVQLPPGQGASEGTGLGLALSRSLVTLLGGKLTARSQVGKGSTFRFGIEVGLSEGGDLRIPTIPRRVSGLLPGQPQHRILLVDDDSDSRAVFRRALEQTGFHVLEAGNGQEAVDLHATSRPDLILMDLRMPVMDGHEAARRMRDAECGMRDEQGREIHTPIIAVTAHVMERGSLSAISPEFDDLVRKPADAAEMFEKIGRCLDVNFAYQEGGVSESENEDTRASAQLSSADLSVLPRDWLEDFSHASRTGRSRKLLDLIERIQPAHPDLTPVLTEWVRSYRFDRLIAVVEEALKDSSHE